MTYPLRGGEIDACVHHITLTRTEPDSANRAPISTEMARRRRDADDHRQRVHRALVERHLDAATATGHEHTHELMLAGTSVILDPRLSDVARRRSASIQALIRVGRVDDRFSYAPLIVKNHEVVESAATRHVTEGSLDLLAPNEGVRRDGLGLRSTPSVRRDALQLAGATRIVESLGHGDPATRGAIVDRTARVWWLDLASANAPRCNLKAYDALFAERQAVLEAIDDWFNVGGELPTAPYWHRECVDCEFAQLCASQLEASDDVSLTRFTTIEQQRALHAQGIHRRSDLARLDPHLAQSARKRTTPASDAREAALSTSIDKLDELIYRARAHVAGTSLRILDAAHTGCPVADVEVDIDMESYGDATYLWGATVTLDRPLSGIASGHMSFAVWDELTPQRESENFARFWHWFAGLRRRCHEEGLTFAAYCFWAQAEDGAMNRAVALSPLSAPTPDDLEEFRHSRPAQWIDMHDLVKRQIQTEGPLGLKQLATAAGFRWRDVNPSGEASMQWYEVARGDDEEAMVSRQRILDYNEDDCRATKALRDWLNLNATSLPHRDEIPEVSLPH